MEAVEKLAGGALSCCRCREQGGDIGSGGDLKRAAAGGARAVRCLGLSAPRRRKQRRERRLGMEKRSRGRLHNSQSEDALGVGELLAVERPIAAHLLADHAEDVARLALL